MRHEHVRDAEALGRSWAEQKAETLRELPAVDWPDIWEPRPGTELPFAKELSAAERESLLRVAHHEAAERWAELVTAEREIEDAADEEHDQEAEAIQLFEGLRDDLPAGLEARRDGPRVYLEDLATGRETTVTSLEHAWKVVAEWLEHTRPA
jgi:hypothetical protein